MRAHSAAVRRARRKPPYRMLAAPVHEAYDRLAARLPDEFKDPVKRALRRAKRTHRHRQPSSPLRKVSGTA